MIFFRKKSISAEEDSFNKIALAGFIRLLAVETASGVYLWMVTAFSGVARIWKGSTAKYTNGIQIVDNLGDLL